MSLRATLAIAFIACTPKSDPVKQEAAPPPAASSVAPLALCGPAPKDARSASSADGKTKVWVETDPSRTDSTGAGDIPHQRLCVSPGRVLLEGRGAPDGGGVESALADFDDFHFAPDDTTLYFTSAAWATSDAAHVVDVATGKEHYVIDGVVERVLGAGPHKGDLLVQSWRLDSAHPVDSPAYRGRMQVETVVSPAGKTIATVPEDKAAREKMLGTP